MFREAPLNPPNGPLPTEGATLNALTEQTEECGGGEGVWLKKWGAVIPALSQPVRHFQ
jgi:hypothetical protein